MLKHFFDGRYLKIPIIAGTCTDEGTKGVPRDTDNVLDALEFINNQAFGALSIPSLDLMQQMYLDVRQPVFPESGSLWRQLSNAHGDYRAHCVTAHIQDCLARDGVTTWNYRYGVLDPEQEAEGFGAYHTVELNGVFGPNNTDGAPPSSYFTTNAPIVPLTMAYWASFVRTLDPNGIKLVSDMPEWRPWTVEGKERLLFQTGNMTMEEMPSQQKLHCRILESMLDAMENPSSARGSVNLSRTVDGTFDGSQRSPFLSSASSSILDLRAILYSLVIISALWIIF
jgi:carboxylesterase type B